MYSYVFDLGGVLVNYNGKELADRLYEASKGDYEMIRKLLSFEYLYPIETGRMSTKEYYEKYVTKAMPGLSFDTLTDIYAEHFTPNAPGIELLRMIKRKGRKVYLLSNLADFHKTAAERRIPDVFALFDKQFLSYEMGCHKPEPEIYAKACAHIGNEPDKIVFFVGRLVREKGVQVLLEAAPEVIKSVPDVHFFIAGKGPMEAQLKEQAKNLGLESHVSFLGYIEEEMKIALTLRLRQLYFQAYMSLLALWCWKLWQPELQ